MDPRHNSGATIGECDGNPRHKVVSFPARDIHSIPQNLPRRQAAFVTQRFGLTPDHAAIVAALAFGGCP
jgi:hypothetical protein